jgi:hypothetical protein
VYFHAARWLGGDSSSDHFPSMAFIMFKGQILMNTPESYEHFLTLLKLCGDLEVIQYCNYI